MFKKKNVSEEILSRLKIVFILVLRFIYHSNSEIRNRKLKRKILFIGIGILIVGFLFYYLGWSLASGSYARAETYKFNVPEKNTN
jgi:hypothetical protein